MVGHIGLAEPNQQDLTLSPKSRVCPELIVLQKIDHESLDHWSSMALWSHLAVFGHSQALAVPAELQRNRAEKSERQRSARI